MEILKKIEEFEKREIENELRAEKAEKKLKLLGIVFWVGVSIALLSSIAQIILTSLT